MVLPFILRRILFCILHPITFLKIIYQGQSSVYSRIHIKDSLGMEINNGQLLDTNPVVDIRDAVISISFKEMAIFAINSFNRFNSLIELDLSRNFINYLPPLDIPNLRYLNLSYNSMRSLKALETLPRLINLNVTGNFIHDFELSLRTLEVLRAKSCYSATLLLDTPNLVFLNFDYNSIKEFEQNVPNLSFLSLEHNNLSFLPDLSVMPCLKKLILDGNFIRRVELEHQSLSSLYLKNNRVNFVGHFVLPKLKHLDLGHNMLTELPNLSLPSLRYIMLRHNGLVVMPDIECPLLKSITLEFNKVQFVGLSLYGKTDVPILLRTHSLGVSELVRDLLPQPLYEEIEPEIMK